jgi:hypothetical protein
MHRNSYKIFADGLRLGYCMTGDDDGETNKAKPDLTSTSSNIHRGPQHASLLLRFPPYHQNFQVPGPFSLELTLPCAMAGILKSPNSPGVLAPKPCPRATRANSRIPLIPGRSTSGRLLPTPTVIELTGYHVRTKLAALQETIGGVRHAYAQRVWTVSVGCGAIGDSDWSPLQLDYFLSLTHSPRSFIPGRPNQALTAVWCPGCLAGLVDMWSLLVSPHPTGPVDAASHTHEN